MLYAVTKLNAHGPPEDGRKYGPKHVGASFKVFLSVLSINVNW